MSYLLIKPNDTLFFRNGVPFSKGEETVAETNIIPYPSTVWGAMFSVLLIQNLVSDISKKSRDMLKIKAIYLYDDENKNVFVPAPLDIFNDDKKVAYSQEYIEASSFCHSLGETYSTLVMPLTNNKVENANGFFVQVTDLVRHYPYKNNYPYITLYDASDLLTVYDKIGIARSNDTRTAEEGSLYRVEMLVYKDNLGIVVEYESDVDFPTNGILKLGGEAKTAAFKKIDIPIDLQNVKEHYSGTKMTDCCKVYFQTPTFIPNDFSDKLNVEAAFIGKTLSIGGFDVDKKEPKPMQKAIPAGSYYIVSSEEEQTIDIWKSTIQNILEPLNEKGFGSFQIIPIEEFN
jgi:CRISPR-associated protein Cmr3